ncbi:MAG: hypothetical protein N4A63_14275 [Vallitalea sp.]|jgi:hypothetical protein|nr:hypothetical protein [Vallitalea sp.]
MGFYITTLAGGFVFAFMVRIMWGKYVDNFGAAGGNFAAAFIVALCWTMNHGCGLIQQSGTAWVDMAWAVAAGMFFSSAVYDKASISKALPTVLFAILGGTLGGFILSNMPMFLQ